MRFKLYTSEFWLLCFAFSLPPAVFSQTISLAVPDTVCVNGNIGITNNTKGAYSHYWSFCNKASVDVTPSAVNLGNPGSALSDPCMSEPVFDGTDYYLFVTNYSTNRVTKLKYGSSYTNTPTVTNMGSLSSYLSQLEGIEIKKEGSNWIGFVTGSNTLLRLEFGSSIDNNSPSITNLGNIGSMAWPHELHMFLYNNSWYGLVANRNNNSISRLSFGSSLMNTPTGDNLGSIGITGGASGMEVVRDAAGNFYIFVTDVLGKRVSRVELGKNIMNKTPTYTQYNNVPALQYVMRGVMITKNCDEYVGFVTDESSHLIKMSMPDGPGGSITFTNLGNLGSTIRKTNDISSMIRVDDIMYTFVCNPGDNTLTRLTFSLCNGSKELNSSESSTPPPLSYKDTGRHTVNYTINYGEATQKDTCFTVSAILCCDSVSLEKIAVICKGSSGRLVLKHPGVLTGARWYRNGTEITGAADKDTLFITDTGTYTVTVTNSRCQFKDKARIGFDTDTLTISGDSTVCSGDSVRLSTVKPYASYLWSNNATGSIIFAKTAGDYSVTVKNTRGCLLRDTLTIKGLPEPLVPGLKDLSLCEAYLPYEMKLKDTCENCAYSWSGGGTGPHTFINDSGEQVLTISNACGTVKDTFRVHTSLCCDSPGMVKIAKLCRSDIKFLKISYGIKPKSIEWYRNNTLMASENNKDSTMIAAEGLYRVITRAGKCEFTDSVEVSYYTDKMEITADTTFICKGNSASLSVTDTFSNYTWSTGSKTSNISVNTGGDYSLTATSHNGCILKDTARIRMSSKPLLSPIKDTAICDIDMPFKIQVRDTCTGCDYSWSDGSTGEAVFVSDSGDYTLTVSNVCGSTSETFTINRLSCKACILYIPDAFSPNRDIINDSFHIGYDCQILNWEMKIYDRWGELLAVLTDPDKGWDGMYNGEKVQTEVFMYVLSYEYPRGRVNTAGTFHLFR